MSPHVCAPSPVHPATVRAIAARAGATLSRTPGGRPPRAAEGIRARLASAALAVALHAHPAAADPAAVRGLADLLREPRPWTMVPASLFEALGEALPDGGARVRQLADLAPGGAVDPRALERLDPETVGYRARWIEHRFDHYGLPWDITALRLDPVEREPGLPTIALVHGGAANWYEFFLDPMNGPGIAQYLAQKTPVVLLTIPGNFRHGGWPEPIPLRQPRYLLDRELPPAEVAARNAMFTFALVAEGVAQVVERHVPGPLLIVGHSTGGEVQFLLKDRLKTRLRGLSLGWGTGGPAHVRRAWDDARGRAREASPSVTTLRHRDATGYSRTYVGPLNPVPGTTPLEVAQGWFAKESRRRPQFKQVLQDVEHRGEVEELPRMREDLRRAVAAAGLGVDAARVTADYFSTMRTDLGGYRRMVSNSGSRDEGHWAEDASRSREVALAARFRKENPGAEIRVLAYETPLTHYGHIERPRELAGALLAGARWLGEAP